MRESCEFRNLNFGVYSRRVNQSGACSCSNVITSAGRKSERTMKDKLIWLYVGTRSCIYIFVLLHKQQYILQRDWSCLAEDSGYFFIFIYSWYSVERRKNLIGTRTKKQNHVNQIHELYLFKGLNKCTHRSIGCGLSIEIDVYAVHQCQ